MNGLERWFYGVTASFKHPLETYFCPVCNRKLPVLAGVVTHDDVPHHDDLVFDDEEAA